MAKMFKIAWLPGDGVGTDVMDAAKKVLLAVDFKAEYIHGDIGYEFWCKEANPFPDRTIKLLKETDCAMFGAITSKNKEQSAKDLAPEFQGKGLIYSSPIVTMRQMFDLYSCIRPCKAFPKNPLNYKETIDITVYRENTEGLYAGVEFCPIPEDLRQVLLAVLEVGVGLRTQVGHHVRLSQHQANGLPQPRLVAPARGQTVGGVHRLLGRGTDGLGPQQLVDQQRADNADANLQPHVHALRCDGQRDECRDL